MQIITISVEKMDIRNLELLNRLAADEEIKYSVSSKDLSILVPYDSYIEVIFHEGEPMLLKGHAASQGYGLASVMVPLEDANNFNLFVHTIEEYHELPKSLMNLADHVISTA